MPAEQWYYQLDGKSHGPFTPVQFHKLIRGKAVTEETPVSTDGETWQTLREVLDAPPSKSPGASDWQNAPTLVPGQLQVPDSPPPPDANPPT